MTATKLLLEGLKAHYRKPGTDQEGEVLLTEVEAPGSYRSCDLLRVGMWASRGLGIDVHELKTSRSDWLRELDDPGKADAWWPYCNRFWVVAPAGVVDPAELPDGWGLLNPPTNKNHRRFKPIVKAAEKAPKLTLALFIAILKRADNVRVAEMAQMRSDHRNEVYKEVAADRRRREQAALGSEVQRRLSLLAQVEAAIGSEISEMGWGKDLPLKSIEPLELAAAVQEYTQEHVALQRRREGLDKETERLRRNLERTLNALAPDQAKGDAA